MLSSNPLRVAVTVITTKGVPRIMWAIIMPGNVAANPTLASEKNIADPDIIKGIIIGEIKTLIINCLYGMYLLLNPRAAIVPSVVAPIVEKNA
jgi:hypothetical protein